MTTSDPADPTGGATMSPTSSPPVFTGVAVALATFFDDHGAVDLPATTRLAVDLVDAGLDAILVAGTTGEATHLSPTERLELVAAVRSGVGDAVPVIAGTGDLAAGSPRDAVALSTRAIEAGADGVLVLPVPGDDVIAQYDALRAGVGTSGRILAYHHPSHRPPGISLEDLCAAPVDGVKDSSGDPGRLLDERVHFPGALYTGSAALVFTAGAIGATGAILAAANLEPRRCLEAFAGDAEAQVALQGVLAALRPGAAAVIKGRLHECYATTSRCR